VLVELNALARLITIKDAQVLNYLKATRLPRALPVNFGGVSLERKRFVLNLRKSAQSADPLHL